MPPRGNQPQERVCAANWRRSLCAAKRDPRLGGYTSPRPPKRKSEGAGAKRKQYYFSFLTPPPLPPLLSRGLRGCERGATVERSETGERAMFAPAGQTTARAGLRSKLAALVVRRQAPPNPRCRKQQSVGAGHARPAALLCHPFAFCIVGRGLDPSAAFRRRPVTPLPPNPLLTPSPPLSLSPNFTNFTRSTQNLPPLCKTFTAIVPYYGRNRRKTAVQLACFR